MKSNICILIFSLLIQNQSSGQDFLNKWDFDQDGKNDSIKFDYSGGAHCCYSINIKLSSKNNWQHFAYEMDGGYVMGVDGSQPQHFNIKDYDNDSVPEIFMETGTYGGGYGPWSEQILIDCENGILYDKSFDIYEYDRSKKKINCSGKNGFTGYYVGRDDDAINSMDINKDGTAVYSSRPRGVAGWEYNYSGKWEMSNNKLKVTYDNGIDSTNPDERYPLDNEIVEEFEFSEEGCLLKQTDVKYGMYYFMDE